MNDLPKVVTDYLTSLLIDGAEIRTVVNDNNDSYEWFITYTDLPKYLTIAQWDVGATDITVVNIAGKSLGKLSKVIDLINDDKSDKNF